MKSSVTLSLVPEVRGGPFVFWDDLPGTAQTAAALGFDALEIFPPDPAAINSAELRPLLQEHNLNLSALGTGAGWVKHRLSLTTQSDSTRSAARDFIRRMIDAAAPFQASVIIGSMQGKHEGAVSRSQALEWLAQSLMELGAHAQSSSVTLLYEPLNRYETNLLNRLEDTAEFLRTHSIDGVKILADLFHMNIEESSLPAAIDGAGPLIGHVHLADSNRRPAGCGHTDFATAFAALRRTGYNGYVSAECLPFPDSLSAAGQTIQAFRKFNSPDTSTNERRT